MIKHKAGEFYWYAWYDDEDGKVYLEEYGLRSIRKGIAYFTLKSDGITWGKRSKKHGDYGWLSNIPVWCRTGLSLNGETIQSYAKTQTAALRSAIANERRTLARHNGDSDMLSACEVNIQAMKKQLKKLTNKATRDKS